MTPVCIKDATHVFGKPLDWRPEGGDCADLHVRRTVDPEIGPELQSAWKPDADELAALNAGGVVILNVVGDEHPPVALWVEDAPASPKTELAVI